ncbi:MAG: hypothetical protein JO128_21835 [Alphaproteobacteria bacterium]|nr:hypothetical protein [Alphaproteobacteria bacterium]
MIGFVLRCAALTITALAASGGNLAFARSHAGSPTSTFAPAYLDSDRCRVLIEQWTAAHARSGPEYGDNVASLSTHGRALCTAGYFASGADELEQAIRLIGETPDKPRPVIRLR